LFTYEKVITHTLLASIFDLAILAVDINILAAHAFGSIWIGGVKRARGALVGSAAGFAVFLKSSAFVAG